MTPVFLTAAKTPATEVLVSSLVSASPFTVVAGKVYNSDHSSTISGANVVVTCTALDDSITTQSGTSTDDGSYTVLFEASACPQGSSVVANATKGDQNGNDSGDVNTCDGQAACQSDGVQYISISNPTLKSPSAPVSNNNGGSSGGGGGGSSGGSSKKVTPVVISNNVSNTNNVANNAGSGNNQTAPLNLSDSSGDSGSSGITGGVIGSLGAGSWILILLVIAIVLIAYVIVKGRKMNAITSNLN